MPKMKIQRSIEIDAPADKVFPKLNNFNEWTPWSPWLIMEPAAKVTVASDTKSYKWEGDRVGAGNMKVLEERENEYINYDLNFLKPWKSHANTDFSLSSSNGKTKVTWGMDSSLPWFLFWMKKMTEAFISADYDRGLSMLKAYVETGTVPSKLGFTGKGNFEGCQYVGIKTDTALSQVGEKMSADFGKLGEWAATQEGNIGKDPFSIYHKWDMVKDRVVYTSGFPVKEIPENLPAGFVSGTIPPTPTYTIQHTGPYQHLGNAWGTLYNMKQNKEIKMNKKIDPFEFYRNDPTTTPAEELITDVSFAIK